MPSPRLDITLDTANEALARLGYDDTEAPPVSHNGDHHANGFDLDGFIGRAALEVDGPHEYNGGRRWIFTRSPLCDHHDKAAFLIQRSNGVLQAGCQHNSCSWNWHTLRAKYEPKRTAERQWQRTQSDNQEHADLPEITYQRITAAELDAATFSLEYLLDDTLTAGQPAIIAGGKKCLKTNIIIDAAISLPTGLPFLGEIRTLRKTRTAIMTGESGMATIQETARRICAAKGIALAEVPDLIFSPDLPRIGDLRHQQALAKWLVENGIEALFLDPAYLCLPCEDNGNLFAMGMLLRSITEVCQAVGVTLFLVHHTKKNIVDPFAPPELESIAWSGFQEFARQWWLIGRRETYEPGTGHHKLWLNVGGSAGHSALWAVDIDEGTRRTPGGRFWQVSLTTASEARQEAQQQRQTAKANEREQKQAAILEVNRRKIVEALTKVKEPLTATTLKERASLGPPAVKAALASLYESGDVEPCKVTKGNNQREFDAWRLKGTDPLSALFAEHK